MPAEEALRRHVERSSKGLIINVYVEPGAGSEGFAIVQGDLVFRTREPEGRGRENAALVRHLSRLLRIPPSKVDIIYGARERHKRVLVMDVDEDRLVSALASALLEAS